MVPFIRYEKYNTHAKTDGGLAVNGAYDRTDITMGAGWWLASGAVLKADYQFSETHLIIAPDSLIWELVFGFKIQIQ